jgi:hypothetical protein
MTKLRWDRCGGSWGDYSEAMDATEVRHERRLRQACDQMVWAKRVLCSAGSTAPLGLGDLDRLLYLARTPSPRQATDWYQRRLRVAGRKAGVSPSSLQRSLDNA